MAYIKLSQYGSMFRLLIRSSKAAKASLIHVYKTEVKSEMAKIRRGEAKVAGLCKDPTLQELGSFAWKDVLDEAQESCPLLMGAMDGAMAGNKVFQRQRLKGPKKDRR